jgi:macrolide-specific efflux system membrane fusion protein
VEQGNDPNKTTATQITLGARGDSAVQIVSGLTEGARIVVVRATGTSSTAATGAGQRTGAFAGVGGVGGGGGGAVGGAGRFGG